jgi:hypothetical protein
VYLVFKKEYITLVRLHSISRARLNGTSLHSQSGVLGLGHFGAMVQHVHSQTTDPARTYNLGVGPWAA